MTGVLMRINVVTGTAAYISAAHEAPFMFVEKEDFSFVCEDLDFPTSPRLGTLFKVLPEEVKFTLQPNSSILLYTDGLFAIEKPDGKNLNERRFRKQMISRLEQARSAEKMTNVVFEMFDEHRENLPLPDDISIVSIRREGPTREPFLANETGQIEYKST
jgi:serine phosphatase RsbU (regulator of sigma subunit)